MVHPVDRLLQYGSRVEVVVEDKNANVHPKGISFTANNMALVYPLDDAGLAQPLTCATSSKPPTLLTRSSPRWPSSVIGRVLGVEMLESAQYYRDNIFVYLAMVFIFSLLAYPVVRSN